MWSVGVSGVVEYLSRDDMKAAIRNLDDTRLGGKYIRVREVSCPYCVFYNLKVPRKLVPDDTDSTDGFHAST